MRIDRSSLSLLVSLSFVPLASCGSEDSDSPAPSGTGGAVPTGGTPSTPTGGTTSKGGTTASGGVISTGGTPAATGGTKAGTGGTPATGGSGGAAAGAGGAKGGSGGAGGTSAGSPGKGGGGAGGSAGASGGSGGTTAGSGGSGGGNATMNFFVTSDSSKTANLGGLKGADMRCQMLAAAVGQGDKTWRAYLSTEEPAVNARDRIGPGPYYNSKGAQVAADKDALHARSGDAELFLDEKGNRINGQWKGSPTPNEHDILTGTNEKGTVAAGQTCEDWTATTGNSAVGHSDGLGPGMSAELPYSRWVGTHTGQCGNTEPGGGAGKLYCFVGP